MVNRAGKAPAGPLLPGLSLDSLILEEEALVRKEAGMAQRSSPDIL